MKNKKKHPLKKHVNYTTVILVLIAIAFGLMHLTTHARLAVLEDASTYQFTQGLTQMVNDRKLSFDVDGAQKAAYIPGLSLKMNYDHLLTDQLRYDVLYEGESAQRGEIYLTHIDELNRAGMTDGRIDDRACLNAYHLTVDVNTSDSSIEKQLFKKQLQDGRQLAVYGNTEESCEMFSGSGLDEDITALLRSIESY